MKDLQSQYTADPRKEPSALAKIFGDFLKRQSSSCGEIIESIGTKTVAASGWFSACVEEGSVIGLRG